MSPEPTTPTLTQELEKAIDDSGALHPNRTYVESVRPALVAGILPLVERNEAEVKLLRDALAQDFPELRAELAALREALATAQQERDEWKTLAGVGTWHADCRPNRQQAAREILKQQQTIDKLADTITELRKVEGTVEAVRALQPRIRECFIQGDNCAATERLLGELLTILGAAGTPTPQWLLCSCSRDALNPACLRHGAAALPAGTAEPRKSFDQLASETMTPESIASAKARTADMLAAGTGPQEPRPTPPQVQLCTYPDCQLMYQAATHCPKGHSSVRWAILVAAPTRQPPRAEPPQEDR